MPRARAGRAREVGARERRAGDAATEEVTMIVSLKNDADPDKVRAELAGRGLWVSHAERAPSGLLLHYVIAPHSAAADPAELSTIDGISGVTTSRSPTPLVDRQGPVADVSGVPIGGGGLALVCGPCSIESEAHVHEAAEKL